jgi:hypothetical protein
MKFKLDWKPIENLVNSNPAKYNSYLAMAKELVASNV